MALSATPEPVLVELYSSEGCSSCPSADAALQERSAKDDSVLALEFHVDYWNSLGWADPFSSAAYTERQSRYAVLLNSDQVFTPQAIVDGRTSLVGSDRGALQAAIARARTSGKPTLSVAVAGRVLSIAATEAPAGRLWVAVTESGLRTAVPRGENAGRVLEHAPVVRSFQSFGAVSSGAWSKAVDLALDAHWKPGALRVVVAVQDPDSGAIRALGSTRL